MKYSKGYKYILREDEIYKCKYIKPDVAVSLGLIILTIDGTLIIKAGYASDGASGTTIDTKSSMRGAFIHDALFQMMRRGLLNREKYFHLANKEFYNILVEDGMFRARAWLWFKCVENFSYDFTLPEHDPKILIAP